MEKMWAERRDMNKYRGEKQIRMSVDVRTDPISMTGKRDSIVANFRSYKTTCQLISSATVKGLLSYTTDDAGIYKNR